MTTTRIRKSLASIALAATVPLVAPATGAAASQASEAIDLTGSGGEANGLTGRDLLNGGMAAGIAANELGLAIATPTVEISHTPRFSSLAMAPEAPAASTLIPQTGVEVAQAVQAPVDDTFAPLTDEEIRQQLLIDPNSVLDRPRPVPASGFLTPSAYGADWGDAFVGLAGVTAGNESDLDGSASLGFGIGNAIDSVGLEVSLGIISLDGFADDGIVGFKLHKVFPQAGNLGVAVGWSNAIKWGDAGKAEDTFYGVVTKRFELRPEKENTMPLTASLGVGTGTFRSIGAIDADDNAPNVFGSVGVRVIPEVSLISSWTGSALGLATSAAPFDFPLVFTAGVSDVTGNTDEGARFNASVGYSFSF